MLARNSGYLLYIGISLNADISLQNWYQFPDYRGILTKNFQEHLWTHGWHSIHVHPCADLLLLSFTFTVEYQGLAICVLFSEVKKSSLILGTRKFVLYNRVFFSVLYKPVSSHDVPWCLTAGKIHYPIQTLALALCSCLVVVLWFRILWLLTYDDIIIKL